MLLRSAQKWTPERQWVRPEFLAGMRSGQTRQKFGFDDSEPWRIQPPPGLAGTSTAAWVSGENGDLDRWTDRYPFFAFRREFAGHKIPRRFVVFPRAIVIVPMWRQSSSQSRQRLGRPRMRGVVHPRPAASLATSAYSVWTLLRPTQLASVPTLARSQSRHNSGHPQRTRIPAAFKCAWQDFSRVRAPVVRDCAEP